MRSALPPLILLTALALGGCHRQAAEGPQATAPEAAAPGGVGTEASKVSRANAGKAAPDTPFDDLATHGTTTLAAFKGHPVLVNLWATWCGPCVRELPTLAALARAKGAALPVLAISQDMQGESVVPPYLKKAGLDLHPYHDRDNALMLATKEAGLPVTILYGPDGRERWRVTGGMDWSSKPAAALLAEAGA